MDNLPNQSQLDLLLILVCSMVVLFFIYTLINYYWSSIISCCCNKNRYQRSDTKSCLRNGNNSNDQKLMEDFLLKTSTYKRFAQEFDEDEEIVIWNNLNAQMIEEREKKVVEM